jgi:hypothetical protein
MAKAAKKITGKHWIILGAIEIVWIIIYFGFISPNLPGLISPLGRFAFPENEWFEAQGVEITDSFTNTPFTVANDELFYNIKYTNKKPFTIAVKPDLQVLYGGEIVRSVSADPVNIDPMGSNEHHVRFFTDKVGINQIVFKVNVLNATSLEGLGSVQETYNIKVLSVEAFQQVEQNKIAFFAIPISVAVAIASTFLGIESIRMSRKQMSLQLRPWIGLDSSVDPSHRPLIRVGFCDSGGTEVPDEVFKTNPTEKLKEVYEGWRLWIKNHGTMPASDVRSRVRYFQGSNRPDMEDVMKEPPSVPSGLMINEQMPITIGVPAQWIKQENPDHRIFVSIRITYGFGDRSGRYDLIAQYKDRNFIVEYTYFE